MTLQKQHKHTGWEACCDVCNDYVTLQATSFDEALAELKKLGWQPVHVNSSWEHHCAVCSKDAPKRDKT